MTLQQIIALAASGESEMLEFKKTTGGRREAAKTVCAFLNQDGGLVLFGVTPDGAVVGQQVSEHTIEELSAGISAGRSSDISDDRENPNERWTGYNSGQSCPRCLETVHLPGQRISPGRKHNIADVSR